jgi:prolyl-tRNA synthetase
MHDVYDDFFRNICAMYGVKGEKSESERFAGAEHTYTIESMMQDGKALQNCTSHDLGQNFGKAFDVKFTTKDNTTDIAYATSRGCTTRSIGAVVMAHSDDKGLILPPALAPIHVVIVPFFKTEEELEAIESYLGRCLIDIKETKLSFATETLGDWTIPLTSKFDADDGKSPGWKFNEYELQGVPVRITVGKKEMEQGMVEIYRRDTGEKQMVAVEKCSQKVVDMLYDIQQSMFLRHQAFQESNTVRVDSYEDFKQALDDGKFVLAHRDGTAETEAKIKEECKAVTRCIPFDSVEEIGACIYTGKESKRRVLFARSY